MPMKSRVKRLAHNALLLTVALIFSYIESVIPVYFIIPIPGFKLGLANIIVMFVFYYMNKIDALFISLARIFLIALLFGNISSFYYSLAGAVFAYITLCITFPLKRSGVISFTGVSVLCSASHNTGQIMIAAVMFESAALMRYLPWLLVISIPAGIITGIILQIIGRYKILNFLKTSF